MSSPRRRALEALIDITEHGAYANLRLKQAAEESADASGWISAAVYTTLDHLFLIDYYIDHFAEGRLKPQIRGILRLGAAQALFMQVPMRAACDESVKLCREIGKSALAGFVNGVMRNLCRAAQGDALPPLPTEPLSRMVVQYSYPRFLVEAYIDRYGEAFTEAMLSYKQHGMTLRAQPPYTTSELEAYLTAQGIPYHKGEIVGDALHVEKGFSPSRDPLFANGSIAVQSESAMLVCKAVDVPSGSILDACCAPGGKAAYLSALMGGNGYIQGFELHPHRVALTEKTFERLHVHNARIACADASILQPALFNTMDAVLIDAPCSGLGLPDKPDVRYAKTDGAIRSLAALQRSILDACCGYVKPGGTLVYATCTISAAENEEQIASFLERHTEYQADSLAPYVPASMQSQAASGMLQLFPHLHKTEGFFVAKMRRRA